MKTPFKLPLFIALAALAAVPASAATVESLKIEPTVKPRLSGTMLLEGVTEGKLVVAIAVDAQGRLTDSLVLSYTHRGLVSPCLDALKEWKYMPPTIDGVPVPVQTEIAIDFRAEGVVVSSSNGVEMLNAHVRRFMADRFVQAPCPARDLDAAPVLVNPVMPRYAKEAAAQGVRGTVQVHFYIDESGTVRMPAVDSGADPYLASVAVSAIREWRFQPPTSRGSPVLVAAVQDFRFGN